MLRVKENRVHIHALQLFEDVLAKVGLAGTSHSNDGCVALRDVTQEGLRQLFPVAHTIHAHVAMRASPPMAMLR